MNNSPDDIDDDIDNMDYEYDNIDYMDDIDDNIDNIDNMDNMDDIDDNIDYIDDNIDYIDDIDDNMDNIDNMDNMDSEYDSSVTMNLRQAAVGAILKTLPNYKILRGTENDFIKSFLTWIKVHLDPEIYNVDGDPDWTPKKNSDKL